MQATLQDTKELLIELFPGAERNIKMGTGMWRLYFNVSLFRVHISSLTGILEVELSINTKAGKYTTMQTWSKIKQHSQLQAALVVCRESIRSVGEAIFEDLGLGT